MAVALLGTMWQTGEHRKQRKSDPNPACKNFAIKVVQAYLC